MKKKVIAALLLAGSMLTVFGCNGKNPEKEELSLRDLDMSKYVTLGEYKGVSIDKVEIPVSNEDVQNRIDIIVNNNIDVFGITDREVKEGDKVSCDLRCYVDDVAVSSAKKLGEVFVVGDGEMRSEVDEGVVGMMPGESKKIKVSFESNYSNTELAGKDAILLIKVNAIIPETITDEMVAKMGSTMYSTADELEAYVRSGIETSNESDAESQMQNKIISTIVENSTISGIPQEFIDDQIDKICAKYDYESGLAGYSTEEYVELLFGMNMKELAVSRLNQRVVIEAIAQEEGIGYTDESYRAEIKANAESMGITEDIYFLLNNAVDNEDYIEQLTFDKVVELVYENAVIN